MTSAPACPITTDIPQLSVAGALLEALAGRDFERLAGTLAADVSLQALVPIGLKTWEGRAEAAAAFAGWFGDATGFELMEAVVGEVGVRLHLQWRVRLRAERLGPGWFQVEQHAYADTDATGRITALRLLCSGYCAETRPGI